MRHSTDDASFSACSTKFGDPLLPTGCWVDPFRPPSCFKGKSIRVGEASPRDAHAQPEVLKSSQGFQFRSQNLHVDQTETRMLEVPTASIQPMRTEGC